MTPRAVIVSPFAPPHRGGVEGFVGWLEEALAAEGYEPRIITSHGDGSVRWPVARVQPANIPLPLPSRRLNRLVREEIAQADVVLIQNFFWPLSWIAAEAVRRSGVRAFTFVHGNELVPHGASMLLRGIASVQARTLARRQLRIAPPVANSQSTSAFLRRVFGIEAPVLPLPLVLDLPIGDVRVPDPTEPVRIVFAARLVPLKDPLAALHAVSIVGRARTVEFIVFGDGPVRGELGRDAPPWLDLRGARPRSEVLHAVSRAHLFLSTSKTDSAQTSLLEAIGLGVPSVATMVGEAPSYLDGVLRTCLAPAGDPEAIAATITSVIGCQYADIAHATRERALDLRAEHAEDRVASQLRDVLRLRPAKGG